MSGGLLRAHAYATLNSLILSAADDKLDFVKLLITEMINILNQSFEMAKSAGDVSHYIEIQGQICGVLQVGDYKSPGHLWLFSVKRRRKETEMAFWSRF